MSGIDPSSLANAVGVGAENIAFLPGANVLQRKIAIVGTYDPLILTVADDLPVRVSSPAEVGALFGFGFMLHRLAVQAFLGSGGIETYIIPQAEAGGAVAAAGEADFTGSVATAAGTLYAYIGGIRVAVPIPDTTTAAAGVALLVAAILAQTGELTVTSAINVTPEIIDITAKSKGLWGNGIDISFNLGAGEEFPTGFSTVAVTAMTGGTGVPDITTALETGLGTGDAANELGITDMVHGYGLDTGTFDKISAYVGAGNLLDGLYSELVGRPFRALSGDTTPDAAGLTALQVITDARLTDRADGVVWAPGSESHPSEIAAQTIGHMARVNNTRAEESYGGIELIGIWPGATASERITDDYANRDAAVKSGISPTLFRDGALQLQNVVTFYRPSSVPVESNGYRSMRNISITQNVLNAIRVVFESSKWQGISIVADTNLIGNPVSKLKARDIDSVKDDLLKLATDFESLAWIFSSAITVAALKEAGSVTIRAGGNGFDSILKLVYSGEGGILDTLVLFDTNVAAATL